MKERIGKLLLAVVIIAVVAILAVLGFFLAPRVFGNRAEKKEVITVSTLEKIINVSELSTFTAIYNGVAQVMNKENTDAIDYYVSYEAKVDAGIDFEKINIIVDNAAKTIQITVPEVYITDINVNIASMDYIFMNNKANTSSVSQEAFKACETDAQSESEKQEAIFELAAQNAKNILTALTRPIIEQLDEEYVLTID